MESIQSIELFRDNYIWLMGNYRAEGHTDVFHVILEFKDVNPWF